jgi:hypothetical protein
MTYNYIGELPGKGSLIKKKQQREKGRAKNIYILGMHPDLATLSVDFTMKNFGGEQYGGTTNAYLFNKRFAAEQAWTWFVLRYS